MKKTGKVLLILLLLLAVAAAGVFFGLRGGELPEILQPEPEPIQLGGQLLTEETTELTLKAGEAALDDILTALPQLPGLAKLTLPDTDLSAAQLQQVRSACGGAELVYTVEIAGRSYGPETTELDFSSLTEEEMLAAAAKLELLPAVTVIRLSGEDGDLSLSAGQLDTLREKFSGKSLEYSVSLLGQSYGPETDRLDLSAMTPEELPAVLEKLPLLPRLQELELMDAEGVSQLSMADVKALMDALPEGAKAHYTFQLFGIACSTEDTRFVYDSSRAPEEWESQIRQALDIMPDCEYFCMDCRGLNNEVMASIRDAYPKTKVVWRVYIASFNMLTDETIARLTHDLTDENIAPLKYCNDVVYMDIGHNSYLHDISFVSNMPNLECVILSSSPTDDLSPFANCKKLVWMELCYCGYVKDLSVFQDHPTLKYLNVSHTHVSDLSVLDNVALERFVCIGTDASQEDQDSFVEKHPDCLTVYEGRQCYGYGWRYNDAGYTFFDYYAKIRELFRYADPDYWGNHKGG